jgi:SAM-dependent methyltransferase
LNPTGYIKLYKQTGDKKYLRDYYRRDDYLSIYAKSNPVLNGKFEALAASMALRASDTVLDVGCSAQMFRLYVEKAGARYTGVDISDRFEPDIVADAEDLGVIADDSFDWVVLSDVLEHLPNPIEALKEARRVGRRVIAVVPNWYQLNCLGSLLPRHPNDRHLNCHPPRRWLSFFAEAGLEPVYTRGYFYAPSVAFYPLLPLTLLERVFWTFPFRRLSRIVDRRFADKPVMRYLGQELMIVAYRPEADSAYRPGSS